MVGNLFSFFGHCGFRAGRHVYRDGVEVDPVCNGGGSGGVDDGLQIFTAIQTDRGGKIVGGAAIGGEIRGVN